jgi:16S rRNA C967 or C1407 C5-methylase (RsmB/RsmF family)/NOL1/NOP2/fmu family ribosome biogenesis protein
MMPLPDQFVQRMKLQLGNEADAFLASLENSPAISIRLHHLKGRSSFELKERIPWCDTGFYLKSRPFFHLDPHWHGGAYYVQEASSMILDHVINQLHLEERSRIWLDLCAAPGGKTGILAKHMGESDILIANEVVNQRRSILRENLVKAGYLNTFISGEPASSFREPLADFILIDAPCAGEGMMRKDPEAIRQWAPSLVQSCSVLQRQIVLEAVHALKHDGYLVYSTCSYSMAENMENIKHFVDKHRLKSVSLSFPEEWNIMKLESDSVFGYQLYPHRLKGEGLFIAVLQKNQDDEQQRAKYSSSWNMFDNVPEWLGSHLSNPSSYKVRKNSLQHEFILGAASSNANQVLRQLPRAELIVGAGESKGKDFIPSHVLAMAKLQHQSYKTIDLDESAALDYLERSINSLPPVDQPGWYLLQYDQTVLGWAKAIEKGWKNHYPMNWRLRDRRKNQV